MVELHELPVLVPVDVLSGQSVPVTVIEALASVPVLLLGYNEVPDQTSAGQAQQQFEGQIRAELSELRTTFESFGCAVSTRIAFTHDRFQTFERVAIEDDCSAIILLNPAPVLESMLVAIRSDVNVDHVTALVAAVLADTEITVTLLHVATSDEERATGESAIGSAAERLERRDIGAERIARTIAEGPPTDAILDVATDHDLLVLGESRPSIRRRIFRDRAERIAKRSLDPVIVIRRVYLESQQTIGENRL